MTTMSPLDALVAYWSIALVAAVLLVLAGFNWSRQQRAKHDCREHGHQWQPVPSPINYGYEGLECTRCGKRFGH